jgi:hypothetical protein
MGCRLKFSYKVRRAVILTYLTVIESLLLYQSIKERMYQMMIKGRQPANGTLKLRSLLKFGLSGALLLQLLSTDKSFLSTLIGG